jgi:hypothetical protein
MRWETVSTTRGNLAVAAQLWVEQKARPADAPGFVWCNKSRPAQAGWGKNTKRMGHFIRRVADRAVLLRTERKRGKRAGDYNVEQHIEFAPELRALDWHSHAPQQPVTRTVRPAVAFRRVPVAIPAEARGLLRNGSECENRAPTDLETTARENRVHSASAEPPDPLVAAALAAFDQARASRREAPLSPAATVRAELAALQAVAQAAQAPPLSLPGGSPTVPAVCACGKPTGGRVRCPACQAAWLQGGAACARSLLGPTA